MDDQSPDSQTSREKLEALEWERQRNEEAERLKREEEERKRQEEEDRRREEENRQKIAEEAKLLKTKSDEVNYVCPLGSYNNDGIGALNGSCTEQAVQ